MKNDVTFAFRQLLKNPGFTAVVVVTLALGIGANTAIFSLVHSILLRPLPYKDADRLVAVYENYAANGWYRNAVAAPMLGIWRKEARAFDGLGGESYSNVDLVLTTAGPPETLKGARISANVFGMLGIKPELGRDFLPEEETFGKNHVALLSHEFWRDRFGGDPTILGRNITLNSEPTTVVGVMPPGTHFPRGEIQAWLPLAFEPWELNYRHAHNYRVLGKLKPGVSISAAYQELNRISAQRADANAEDKGWGVEVQGLLEDMVGDTRVGLLLLLGAVGMVLLIGCANIANLFLTRASARMREFAIRSALGASHARLLRQLFVESLLLSAFGGLCGCLLAIFGLAGLVRLIPPDLPRLWEGVHLSGTTLGFTALLTLMTALPFGLVPALQASNPALAGELAEGAKGTAGPRRGRLRSGLVIAELAVSVMLLIGAGLLIRSLGRLLTQDFGFNPEHIVTMEVNLPAKLYPGHGDRQRLFDALLGRLQTIPGFMASGAVFGLPLSGAIEGQDIQFEGAPTRKPGELLTADYAQVSPGYFAAMNIPLLQGRSFSESDTTNSSSVLMVNESFIRQFNLGTSVLGRRLKVTDSSIESEIIGVVKDVKGNDVAGAVRGEMYRMYKQVCRGHMTLVIRTPRELSDVTRVVRTELDQLDRDLPLKDVRTMKQRVATSVASRRLSMELLAGFAAVAILLAAFGLYGVLASIVSQRTREIGLRTALGARRGDVIRLVLRQGMTLAGYGTLAGLLAAMALTQTIRAMLYGVSPTDPIAFAAVPLILAVVALVACWFPARRAAKVDPIVALRME